MNNQELIERWKEIKCGPAGYCSEPIADLITETITALTPVTDEDVQEWIDASRTASLPHGINDDRQILRQIECIKAARNLIERLAREKAEQGRSEEVQQAVDFFSTVSGMNGITSLSAKDATKFRDLIEWLARERNNYKTWHEGLTIEYQDAQQRIEELDKECVMWAERARNAEHNFAVEHEALEKAERQLEAALEDRAFYKSCALSGEVPTEGSEPSARIREEE